MHGHRRPEDAFQKGDYVMLSTMHRCRNYMQRGDGRTAKFMPRWDGKYKVLEAHPESSTYKLALGPNDKKSNRIEWFASLKMLV